MKVMATLLLWKRGVENNKKLGEQNVSNSCLKSDFRYKLKDEQEVDRIGNQEIRNVWVSKYE